jgi:hypothetical protein
LQLFTDEAPSGLKFVNGVYPVFAGLVTVRDPVFGADLDKGSQLIAFEATTVNGNREFVAREVDDLIRTRSYEGLQASASELSRDLTVL